MTQQPGPGPRYGAPAGPEGWAPPPTTGVSTATKWVLGAVVAAVLLGFVGVVVAAVLLVQGARETTAGQAQPPSRVPAPPESSTPPSDPAPSDPTPSDPLPSDQPGATPTEDGSGGSGSGGSGSGGLGDAGSGSRSRGSAQGADGAPTNRAFSPAPPSSVPLLAATWAPRARTFFFELDGLPSGFRGPAYLGCLETRSSATSTRWTCTDDGGSFPPQPRHDPPSYASVELTRCPAPCAIASRQQLRPYAGRLAQVVTKMDRLDPRTWWATNTDDAGTLMLLARNVDTDGDDRPDHVLTVLGNAVDGDVGDLSRMVRDVYDHEY